MYCSAGNNWFVIEKTDDWKVFRCHKFFHKNIEIYSIKNNFKLCNDFSCKYYKECKIDCDLSYTTRSEKTSEYNNSIIRMSFHPVTTCLNDCVYCGVKYPNNLSKESIPVELTLKLFNDFKVNFPNSNLIIEVAGGEPLLHKNINKIIDILLEYSKNILLFTSIYNINNLKKIINKKIKFIVSCHPTGKMFNMHEFLDGIEMIYNSGNEFSVHIIDHFINKDFIKIYSDLLKKYTRLRIWRDEINMKKTNKILQLMEYSNNKFYKI
jgi:organic radical activating enzyme